MSDKNSKITSSREKKSESSSSSPEEWEDIGNERLDLSDTKLAEDAGLGAKTGDNDFEPGGPSTKSDSKLTSNFNENPKPDQEEHVTSKSENSLAAKSNEGLEGKIKVGQEDTTPKSENVSKDNGLEAPGSPDAKNDEGVETTNSPNLKADDSEAKTTSSNIKPTSSNPDTKPHDNEFQARDSEVSLQSEIENTEVDLLEPAKVQLQLDKMELGPVSDDCYKSEPSTPLPEVHPDLKFKPKLLILTSPIDNSAVESDPVDTPRPEDIKYQTDKMVLGFDPRMMKKRPSITIPEFQESQISSPVIEEPPSPLDDSPTSGSSTSSSSITSTETSSTSSSGTSSPINKLKIGTSKELESVPGDKPILHAFVDKAYELEDASEIPIGESSVLEDEEEGSLEEVKEVLKREAQELDNLVEHSTLQITSVCEKHRQMSIISDTIVEAEDVDEDDTAPSDGQKDENDKVVVGGDKKVETTLGDNPQSGGSESDSIEATGMQRIDLRENKRKRRETTSPRPQDLISALKLTSANDKMHSRPPLQPMQSLETPMITKVPPPTPVDPEEDQEQISTLKKPTTPELTAPGPEVFHEVAIDVPNDMEKRHIAFDIDTDFTDSIRKRLADDEDDLPQNYEKSRMEKFVNYLLCRRDLVDTKLSEKPVKFWDLFKYGNRADTILVIIGLILAAVCGICQPFFAILSGRLANTLLLLDIDDDEFFAQGTQACIMFVVVGAFLVVIAFVQFLCFNTACTRITRRIRNAYLKSILRQNPAWFEKNHSGALNTKLNDNIERIYEGIGDKLGLLTRNMVQYITGIIVALFFSWQMAVPLLIFSPIISFAMAFSGRKISKASREEMKVYANAGCIAEEAITAYRTVAAFNAQEVEVNRYKKELENGVRSGVRKAVYTGALSGALLALVMIFMGTALLYGTFLHSIGIISTPGDIFVVLMAIMSGAYHLGNASPHLMVILTARVAAASVYKTISRIPKIDPYSVQGRKLYDLQGKIIFKNVSFRYPSRPETKVLKSFSFSCNAGQTIALVGHSGSGKSTIVGILNRLYEFESGQVTIDGADIRELNVKWLRTVVGTVQQEPIIFNDTVENNIRQGCDSLTEKDMVEACKMANAHDFIQKLPDGYNTKIGDGGVQLSGGQKQRIAIARTLVRNPKILLLDEATSALDTHSEAMVQSALNNAAKNRTTIVIAHRLSTIRDADRIIVMNKGRFVEMGTHNDLLQRKGAYFKLVAAQELHMGEDRKDDEDEEGRDEDQSSPDLPSATMTLESKQVRESIRQSFQRDFMPSVIADAETEAYNIELEKAGYRQASFGQIFLDAKELWPLLSAAMGICFFNALAMPVNAFIYGQAFQMFEDGRKDNISDAFIFFLFFIGLGVIALIASFSTTYLFGKIGERLTMSMRVRAFRSIIYQDGSYFDNPSHTPGKLITRLATDAPNVKAAMDTRLARVAQGILALLAAVVISLFMDWKFALTCSFSFVVLGIFQFTIAKMAHSHAVKFAQEDEAGRIAIEAIENVRTIQLLTSEHTVHQNFTECSMKRQKAEIRKAPIEALNFATTHGLQYFTLAFCYMMGFIFVLSGLTYKVTLFQVVQTIYFGAISVIQATEFFPEFVKSRLAASLMYAIIDRKPRTGKIDAGEKITIEGDVKLDGVYFAYPMRPKNAVMKGISLQARPGQTVALVGPSGSGKSTVIALLERLYDPSLGAVKIDGKDLKTLCLHDVRRQMSLVEQQPRLFSGTIKENIAYGLDVENVSMDEILEAATLANAASFISTLPLGYDTPLGEKGAQLSGGQKQRIAIARAVIRKPKILLLDEATSALDSTSEKAVQEALDKAREGRTCITIAHRLSSIQNSDQIIFVENGRVRERGTHFELIQQQGKYFNLTQQQHLGVQ